MSRKDYELIARCLRAARYRTSTPDQHVGINTVAGLLADALEYDNPRFDRTRFLQAALDNSTTTV